MILTEGRMTAVLTERQKKWFATVQANLEKNTGKPLARVIMKPGDIAAMPAYCRHQGFSPKRSMLLVWENGSPNLVYEIQKGEAPEVPVQF